MSAFDDATLAELERLKAKMEGREAEPLATSAAREMRAASAAPSRRFTDKWEMNPAAVRGLPPDHPALLENRTLFPSTVVEVTEDHPARLLYRRRWARPRTAGAWQRSSVGSGSSPGSERKPAPTCALRALIQM